MTYGEFKSKFYEMFLSCFLYGRSETEMRDYLDANEDFIRGEYEGDLHSSEYNGHPGEITDEQIFTDCDKLEMLY